MDEEPAQKRRKTLPSSEMPDLVSQIHSGSGEMGAYITVTMVQTSLQESCPVSAPWTTFPRQLCFMTLMSWCLSRQLSVP
ncbi:hypothetical protein CALVIDRAFT_534042 [Calocera viscosa TUFC12733]|uniref:Uncharacterized protein n=1 Tax=Calocera viscosa (strain TUFC12733) TaxID=1330018 RepID=A0A167QC79_CALVF|nr:hypothetical protein CALVIDRAFT_534042 [Calocera viscosa TUFC12733]